MRKPAGADSKTLTVAVGLSGQDEEDERTRHLPDHKGVAPEELPALAAWGAGLQRQGREFDGSLSVLGIDVTAQAIHAVTPNFPHIIVRKKQPEVLPEV